ncbi:MAG: hypothetical protein OEP95_09560 [Myxococcales bacterium]|nr:hypothetical protein [Myxococcales bacterium]
MPEPRRVLPSLFSPDRWSRPILLAPVLVALALTACSTMGEMPEDPDAEPAAAVALTVGTARGGSLECATEQGPDCRDWFRFQPRKPGQLRVTARPAAPTEEGAEIAPEARPLQLQLTDGAGNVLAEGEGPEATIKWRVREPGALLARVSIAPGEGAVSYELTTLVERAPRTRAVRRPVLEVEAARDGGSAHVLIDGGHDQSLRVGMRGKLVQDGHSIGRIRIVDVFPQGSRATVEGVLTGDVTPETVAEITLPLP